MAIWGPIVYLRGRPGGHWPPGQGPISQLHCPEPGSGPPGPDLALRGVQMAIWAPVASRSGPQMAIWGLPPALAPSRGQI